MITKKYPRTLHFDFSPEIHSDDKVQYNISKLIGKPIVISYKLDGGNTTLKIGGPFARSHSKKTNCSSFDYIKSMHQFPKVHLFSTNFTDTPFDSSEEFNYHGENMYAIHSIVYRNLKDYFYLFGISTNLSKEFLSWDDTLIQAKSLGFEVVPVLFKGIINSEKELRELLETSIKLDCPLGGDSIEGFVVRVQDSFKISDFSKNVVKFVRRGHVQSDKHWSKNWKKNILV